MPSTMPRTSAFRRRGRARSAAPGASAPGLGRLARKRAAPRIGAWNAELRERALRVFVHPGDAERARLRHALLVDAVVGGEATLLEVEEHPLGHASRLAEARRGRKARL